MKISAASVLYFAVNRKCQWKSHKGPEGSQRAGRGWLSDAASLGASLRLHLSSPGPEEK